MGKVLDQKVRSGNEPGKNVLGNSAFQGRKEWTTEDIERSGCYSGVTYAAVMPPSTRKSVPVT